jgi:uncharacterized protein
MKKSMRIDGHVHLFSKRIIDNVSAKTAMVEELGLETGPALGRCRMAALEAAGARAGLDACLLLPAAGLSEIESANTAAILLAAENRWIRPAGTLHPFLPEPAAELDRLHRNGIRAIKLSSFSQRFSLEDPGTLAMLEMVAGFNTETEAGFFLVLDTYYKGNVHFNADPAHITTPARINALVHAFPQIRVVAAHMGGLGAPPEEILADLPPAANLYLDTSNAAHTLDADSFVRLLARHGPDRIIFGTDWPWFNPVDEMPRIDALLDRAGFDAHGKARVFGENMAGLLELDDP